MEGRPIPVALRCQAMIGSKARHPSAALQQSSIGHRAMTVACGPPARMKACTEHKHINHWARVTGAIEVQGTQGLHGSSLPRGMGHNASYGPRAAGQNESMY